MEIPDELLPCLLAILAVLFTGLGLPRLGRAFRNRESSAAPLLFARGARAVIVGAALAVISGGLLAASDGLVWFGVAFLAEEVFETGVVILILRWGTARGFV